MRHRLLFLPRRFLPQPYGGRAQNAGNTVFAHPGQSHSVLSPEACDRHRKRLHEIRHAGRCGTVHFPAECGADSSPALLGIQGHRPDHTRRIHRDRDHAVGALLRLPLPGGTPCLQQAGLAPVPGNVSIFLLDTAQPDHGPVLLARRHSHHRADFRSGGRDRFFPGHLFLPVLHDGVNGHFRSHLSENHAYGGPGKHEGTTDGPDDPHRAHPGSPVMPHSGRLPLLRA